MCILNAMDWPLSLSIIWSPCPFPAFPSNISLCEFPLVCRTSHIPSFFIFVCAAFSPTTSTLLLLLESLLIIKGNCIDPKGTGKKKKVELVFGILWGMWLTKGEWGRQIPRMWRGWHGWYLGSPVVVKDEGEEQDKVCCFTWESETEWKAQCMQCAGLHLRPRQLGFLGEPSAHDPGEGKLLKRTQWAMEGEWGWLYTVGALWVFLAEMVEGTVLQRLGGESRRCW